MGHERLGTLPDTAPWRAIVRLIAEAADAATIAQATIDAALRGLNQAKEDEGLAFSVWILSQTVRSARQSDFGAKLRGLDIDVPDEPGIFDLVAGVTDAIDDHLHQTHRRTDISEMGEFAAVEALTRLLGDRANSLYGTTPTEVRSAAYDLSTQKGFGTLAHELFARFSQRFLTYHLGRELSLHVGGNGRFRDPAEHTEFVSQLSTHCHEVAAIMRAYASEWYSKHNWQGGITLAKAKGFTRYAVRKMQDELAIRGNRHG